MIEWKFKEDAELVSPEDFWYEVTEGGYIKPGVILGNTDEDICDLLNAIDLVKSFAEAYLSEYYARK